MPKPMIRVVCAAICRAGRYLITQRTDTAVLPRLWEFPGGRVQDGESDATALLRELRYRLGISVALVELISSSEREYDDYLVHMQLYRCELGGVEPRPLMVRDMRWVTSDEFDAYEFTPADQKGMDILLFDG